MKVIRFLSLMLLLLVAGVAEAQFNPDNPPEPEAGLSYTLTAAASPSEGGSVSPGTQKIKAGQAASVYAYPGTDYVFKEWRDEEGNTVSGNSRLQIVMPEHDMRVTAVFVYTPKNPTEPTTPQKYAVVESRSVPSNGGSVSGGGKYAVGTSVRLTASNYTDFVLTGWTVNGEAVPETSRNYYHTVTDGPNKVEAHFRYQPQNPDEPTPTSPRYRLSLVCTPADACSFSYLNTDGYTKNEAVSIRAYPRTGYVFEAWKNDKGVVVSTTRDFTYLMPDRPMTLTACFRYSPNSPAEPESPAPVRNIIYGGREVVLPGGSALFTVNLENVSYVNGINIDLSLPAELKFDMESVLPATRAEGHTLSVLPLDKAGEWRIQMRGEEAFAGANGALLRIPVSVPADAEPGTVYEVVLSHGVIFKTDGSQDAVTVADGSVKIIPKPETLPDSPDFQIRDVEADVADVMPGDAVTLRWTVINGGTVAAVGGWSESLFLTDEAGNRVVLGTVYQDNNGLGIGEQAGRTATITVPRLPGLSGKLNPGVTVTPYLASDEIEQLRANNTTVGSGYPLTLGKLLILSVPETLTEGKDANIRGQLSRSGSWAESETFSLTMTSSDPRLSVPSEVVIPKGQSSASFQITLSDNGEPDPVKTISLRTGGNGYDPVEVPVNITDSRLPGITVTLDPDEAEEGQKVKLTLTIPFPFDEDKEIYLTAPASQRLELPESVIIGAGTTSAAVEFAIQDDKTIEGNQDVLIQASAEGFVPGTEYLTVIDNDIPALELQLTPSEVNENAGPAAIRGVVSRTTNIDRKVTLWLTSDRPGDVMFPIDRLTMEAGVKSVEFTAGVYDNDIVDGDRDVEITAAVYLSACGCTAAGGRAGSVSSIVRIIDNDGPSLTLTATQSTVAEGSPEGIEITVSRNAGMDKALEVTLGCDPAGALEIPASVIIPEGQRTVNVRVTAPANDVDGDNRIVTLTARAEDFAPASLWLNITDRTLPDARIPAISLSAEEVTAGSDVDVTLTLASVGVRPLPEQTCITVYVNEEQATRIWLQEPLEPGNEIEFTRTLTLPATVGRCQIYAVVNQDGSFKELDTSDNHSSHLTVSLTSPYKAGVTVDRGIIAQGETVTVSGRLEGDVKGNEEVEVYVINSGVRNVLTAVTSEDGSFETQYTPYASLGGHFSVGACYPGEGLKEEMASFDIPDIRRSEEGYLTCEAITGQAETLQIAVRNTGGLPLTGLKAELKDLPEGLDAEVTVPEGLDAYEEASLALRMKSNRVTEGSSWETFTVAVTSAEGARLNVPVYWYCRSPKGVLYSETSFIETELAEGKTLEYPVTVANRGAGASGRIHVVLPEWMKMSGPSQLPSLAPGEETTFMLLLTPAEDMALNHYVSGQMAVECENGSGFTVGYKVTPVSDEPAWLNVEACDEYTYNTAEAPRVAGAEVKVLFPGNGRVVSEGRTGEDGVYSAELPAGYYRVEVSAESHEDWSGMVLLKPGKSETVTANISFNPITISYSVVPTEIEDEYMIETNVRYELNVPAPVVRLIVPKRFDGDDMEVGDAKIINIQMVNEGLMTAFNTAPVFEKDNPEWSFELLDYKEPFDLAPHQTVNIPVRVTRIADSSAPQNVSGKRRSAAEDMYKSYQGCMTHVSETYEVICGEKIRKNGGAESMAMKMCATAATMAGVYSAVSNLMGNIAWGANLGGPVPPGTAAPSSSGASTNKQEVGGEQNFSICNKCDAEKADNLIDSLVGLAGGPIGKFWEALSSVVKWYRANGHKIRVVIEKVSNDMLTTGLDMKYKNGGNYYTLVAMIYEVSKPCEDGGGSSVRRKAPGDGSDESDSLFAETDPKFRHSWQETFYNEAKEFSLGWDALTKVYSLIAGDPVWTFDLTPDKQIFMEYVSGLEEGTVVTDEELARIKPESVSFAQAREYLDRRLGIIDVEALYGEEIEKYLEQFAAVEDAAEAAGFENAARRFDKAYEDYTNEFSNMKDNSVCASVGLRFSQSMAMTREAFRGTLDVFNGHTEIPMRDVRLNLTVTGPDGVEATAHEFQMTPESLTGFAGDLDLTAGWELGAGENGRLQVLFIPTRYAAPDEPVVWTFGGSVTYIDPFNSFEVTRQLQPVSLTVNPSPVLDLTYFLQRDVYSDDPLTPDVVEPSEGAEFALVIHNTGAGDARNVRFVTRQPEIVENEKGVLLDTKFSSSQLNGSERHLSLGESIPTDFGDIPAGGASYAQWWFEASLTGHFTEYDVSAVHVTSYDNPDLSLLGNVGIHEMIRGISGPDAGRRLFLVNDVVDSDDLPDTVYFSDGSDAQPLAGAEVSALMTGQLECEVHVTPETAGWVYGKIEDPTGGRLRLSSVRRLSDGEEIPADNFWQTAMTMRDGRSPVHEALLHVAANTASPETYVLTFEPRPEVVLEVSSISGIPSDADGPIDPVSAVTVSFSKAPEKNSFTTEALRLTCAGSPLDLTDVGISPLAADVYSVDLSEATQYEGFYVFTVDASALRDEQGYAGEGGKSVSWLQRGKQLVGLNETGYETENFIIRPVPVRDRMTVSGPFTRLRKLMIHDTAGRLLAEWNNPEGVSPEFTVEGVSSGVMIVTAVTDDGTIHALRVPFLGK